MHQRSFNASSDMLQLGAASFRTTDVQETGSMPVFMDAHLRVPRGPKVRQFVPRLVVLVRITTSGGTRDRQERG